MTENGQQMEQTENVENVDNVLKRRIMKCQEFWTNEWKKQYTEDEVFWKNEIISLNLKSDGLIRENSQLRMKYEASLSKNEALKREFQEKYTAREAEIAEELRKHLGQIETLSNLNSIENKRFEEFRKNTMNKEEYISALENEIKQYQQTILDKTHEFESALTQMKAEIVEAKNNLKKQTMYLESEKSQTQAVKLEKIKSEQAVQKLEAELCKFKEKQEKLKTKVAGLEELLQQQKKKTMENNFHHNRDNENLKAIIESQKCHIMEMRRNEVGKNKVVTKLETKINELERIIKVLHQESFSQKSERNKLLNDLSNEKGKTCILKVSLHERVEMNKNLVAEQEKEREKHKELIRTIKSKTLENRLLKKKYDFLEARYKNGNPEMDKCKLKIKQMENKIISMQCDIQNCVDVFDCPKKFLHYFIQLKSKHLDNTKMTEVDSQFEVFHRYINRLKHSFNKTIASQNREKEKIKNMASKEKNMLYQNSAKAYEALQKCKTLEEEKKALEKKLRMTEKELQILKNPAKSKVQCLPNLANQKIRSTKYETAPRIKQSTHRVSRRSLQIQRR
ncbi:hypothetical protein GOODEAATRI_033485 [Goodea atripinnis]|uniref:Uncharacterized protein n=1 Tax=Goodea atripinnis TaxID=208336 RepID=A0ABV0NRV6_9TELE